MLVSVFLSASTFLRSADGILSQAELDGAKTVIAGAVWSESTRPAFLTALTRVDSTGLPEAAVATGTCTMAAKLPGSDESVGTAEQPAPKFVIVSVAGDDIIGAAEDVIGAGAAAASSELESLPQAAS